MRRTILGVEALAPDATPLAVGPAVTAYTTDIKGVGSAGKGEVQSAFGLKNTAVTTAASLDLQFDSRSQSRVERRSIA